MHMYLLKCDVSSRTNTQCIPQYCVLYSSLASPYDSSELVKLATVIDAPRVGTVSSERVLFPTNCMLTAC
jgi:hypothetical protein